MTVRGLRESDFPRVLKLGDNVYAYEELANPIGSNASFTTNSLIVITPDGVVVADAQGSEAATKRLIEEIGKITPLPIRYVIVGADHEQHRQHQCAAAPVMVGKVAKKPATDRPNDEAEGKQDGRIQLLDDRVAARKERTGKKQGEGGVGVEVVPLDEVADRPDEDRLQPATDVGQLQSCLVDRRQCRRLCALHNAPPAPSSATWRGASLAFSRAGRDDQRDRARASPGGRGTVTRRFGQCVKARRAPSHTHGSRERILIGGRTVDGRHWQIEQAQIDEQLSAMVIPVIQHGPRARRHENTDRR